MASLPLPDGEDPHGRKENPKRNGSLSYERYELYKGSKTVQEARENGAIRADFENDYKKGFLKIVKRSGAAVAAEAKAEPNAKPKAAGKQAAAPKPDAKQDAENKKECSKKGEGETGKANEKGASVAEPSKENKGKPNEEADKNAEQDGKAKEDKRKNTVTEKRGESLGKSKELVGIRQRTEGVMQVLFQARTERCATMVRGQAGDEREREGRRGEGRCRSLPAKPRHPSALVDGDTRGDALLVVGAEAIQRVLDDRVPHWSIPAGQRLRAMLASGGIFATTCEKASGLELCEIPGGSQVDGLPLASSSETLLQRTPPPKRIIEPGALDGLWGGERWPLFAVRDEGRSPAQVLRE
ncbi:unnamed protein product [Prorocentrum cordatum]|uniref:Uncharacterized protein n=1 Tax=Prorocentrum cordatum TaxID=2364126 RepID=A0ABN9T8Q1_9DINO|nr:unnamed protein product [Polarella glacialis]